MTRTQNRIKTSYNYSQILKGAQSFGNKILSFPFHPFLFALFPILFFYSINIKEAIFSEAIPVLAISIVATAVLFAIFSFSVKNVQKSAILLSTIILEFFSYGHASKVIGTINFKLFIFPIGNDKILFSICVLVLAVVIYFLFAQRLSYFKATRVLNIISIILVSISLFNIISYHLSQRDFNLPIQKTKILGQSTVSNNKPDIYYIILDRYAGEKTLKSYNYDNSDFTNYLTSKGFFVTEESTSNYPRTSLSLASSLNMDFVQNLIGGRNRDASGENLMYPLLQDNTVEKFLKSQGYKYFHFGSWWEPTKVNKNADKNFYLEATSFIKPGEFTSKFLSTTMAEPIIELVSPKTILDEPMNHRNRIYLQFEKLPTVVSE